MGLLDELGKDAVIIGFTASREPKNKGGVSYLRSVHRVVRDLEADCFVTGVCWGGDEYITRAVHKYHPKVPLIGVVPGLLRQVSGEAMERSMELIHMPRRSSYRQRNTRIVEVSTRMIAFWTGERKHSGTFMTINIARRAGKIVDDDIHLV